MHINNLEFPDLFVLANKDKSSKRLDKPMLDVSLFITGMLRTLSQTAIILIVSASSFIFELCFYFEEISTVFLHFHYCLS